MLKRLEQHNIYHKLAVAYAGLLVGYITMKSFELVFAGLSYSATEIVAIISAIHIPVTSVLIFVARLYNQEVK